MKPLATIGSKSPQTKQEVILPTLPLPSGFKGWICRYIPAIDSLRSYSWKACGWDLIAGLTVATVAVPQAMAYATLAGLPPQYGLYTAIVMTAVGALLDSSRQLINGPTNAISIALLSALAMVPEDQWISAAIMMAFLVGLFQTGIALMRLGDLTRYVSHSVIVGFTLGAGILLVLDQMKNLLGLTAQGKPSDHFIERFWRTMIDGGAIHWPTLIVGLGTIAIILIIRQINQIREKRGAMIPIPQHLVAMIIMGTMAWAMSLNEAYGVKIVGAIPSHLPSFELPDLKWDQIRSLAGNALALAMLGLLEAIAMAKAIAARTGQKLDINQQCLSEGAANLAGSLFHCFPGSGSLTRSAVNQQAGAVSQWSGVFSALAVAATVALFAPLAQYIPRSALAGLLMLAAFRMVDPKRLLFHLRATRFDTGIVLATAFAAVLISVEFCILIGVFLSFVLYVPRAAQVRLTHLYWTEDQRIRERTLGDPSCDRLVFCALEGETFFGAEPEIEKHLYSIEAGLKPETKVVLLVLKRANNPDAAFLNGLTKFHAVLQASGVILILSGVQENLRNGMKSTSLDDKIAPQHIFFEKAGAYTSTQEALDLAYRILDEDRCKACPRRPGDAKAADVFDYVV